MKRQPTVKSIALGKKRRLSYRYWGGRGRPVVLLHGLLDSAEGWDLLALNIPNPVYAFDLPGFGSSDRVIETSLKGYADDIICALDKLELKNFLLAGHSLGGGVAKLVAEQRKPKSLILLAPAGFSSLPLAELLSVPGIAQITAWVTPLVMGNSFAFRTTYSTFISNRSAPLPELSQRIAANSKADIGGAADALRALSEASKHPFQTSSYQGQIALVWGENDRLVPPSHLKKAQRVYPQAKSVVWAGVGHHPLHEQPQLMERLFTAVLSGKRLPQKRRPLKLTAKTAHADQLATGSRASARAE